MRYIAITWPEIQDYMTRSDYYDEVYYNSNKDVYFIPEYWELEEEYQGGEIGNLEDALG